MKFFSQRGSSLSSLRMQRYQKEIDKYDKKLGIKGIAKEFKEQASNDMNNTVASHN